MVTFKDHITGDILFTAENGTFEIDELFFKFRANYIMVKKQNFEELQPAVDHLWNNKFKVFDMWRVEKDIFDFGEKLGELVERKMMGEDADFTYMVDYIFNLRAWFRANRETKDMKVYIGPTSTYMAHAYVRNFTPIFLKEEDGIPCLYVFKETVHTDGLIEDKLAEMSLKEDVEETEETPVEKEENHPTPSEVPTKTAEVAAVTADTQ